MEKGGQVKGPAPPQRVAAALSSPSPSLSSPTRLASASPTPRPAEGVVTLPTGIHLTDLRYTVPFNHNDPEECTPFGGNTITVFVREVVPTGRRGHLLPYLVYLEGGPGFGAPRPLTRSGWMQRALEEFRVLLIDYRGTGNSTPISVEQLSSLPTPAAQAEYLTHFRADSIVKDCELVRRRLLGEKEKWSLLGQSFGGFLITSYLSTAPHSIESFYVTGGIPPAERSIDDVYVHTFQQVVLRCDRFYARYPQHKKSVVDIVKYLKENHPVRLPSGGTLTPRRFLMLGAYFGMGSGFEFVHYILEAAWSEVLVQPSPTPTTTPSPPKEAATTTTAAAGRGDGRKTFLRRVLSHSFLRSVEAAQPFETNPLYVLLHEAIYCDGPDSGASRWAAERVIHTFPEMDWEARLGKGQYLYFTGEMVFPFMFDCFEQLAPLKAAADLLANKSDWPKLYDRQMLRTGTTAGTGIEPHVAALGPGPSGAAAVYVDDMCVEYEGSKATAKLIPNCKVWTTNEYQHSGLRDDGHTILSKLIGLALT